MDARPDREGPRQAVARDARQRRGEVGSERVAALVRSLEVEAEQRSCAPAVEELPPDRVVLAGGIERLVHVRCQPDLQNAAFLTCNLRGLLRLVGGSPPTRRQ